MASIRDAVMDVLTPLVGAPAANICMYGAAATLGKPAEALTAADLPAVTERIRADMRAFTSPELLEDAIAQIKAKVG